MSTPAAASPNPVTGTTTTLSVLGTDGAGEASLVYTWSATGPASVTFTANGTNASKNTTAIFQQAGTYNLSVLIADSGGSTANSSVAVTVNQTPAAMQVTPGPLSVGVQGTQQFSASISDQFGNSMDPPGGAAGWNTLPNTMLQSVFPPNYFEGQNYAFSFNCANVIRAWSGAVVDALRLRHDHGSVYMSEDFQNEIRFLGIESSPAFVRQPEGNGCIERFFRTLKEQLLWIRDFRDLDELHAALIEFRDRYNRHWILGRLGYRTPAQTRRDFDLAPPTAA